jgi:hypothetical protein
MQPGRPLLWRPLLSKRPAKFCRSVGKKSRSQTPEKLYLASPIKRAKLELVKYFAKTRLPAIIIIIIIAGTNLWS